MTDVIVQVSLLLEDALHLHPEHAFSPSYLLLLPYIDQLQAGRNVTYQVRAAAAYLAFSTQVRMHLCTGLLDCTRGCSEI